MVSVMPPFGGHLGTGSTVFGGGSGDPVELAGGTRYHFAVDANTASSLASSAVAYEDRPGPPSDPDGGGVRQQVGMTTRGKYMQNHIGGKNPHNYSHPGKLIASNGKNSRNSYDEDDDEEEEEDDDEEDEEENEPPHKVVVTHPNGVQRGRRGPVGKNIYNQRVERDRSCSESDGAYDEPSSPATPTSRVTTRGKGKKGNYVQSNSDHPNTSSVNGQNSSSAGGGKVGSYASRGKGGKSIGKRVSGKQNPSIGKRGPTSTSAGKLAPSIGKRNPAVASKGKRNPSIGKKIAYACSGKKNPSASSSSIGKGKRVPFVGKQRVPSKGKRATSNDNLAVSVNGDKERQQQRKSRGKNIENLQRQSQPTHPSNCAVKEETSTNPANGFDNTVAGGAAPLCPPDVYHHHHLHHQYLCSQGNLMMPPPPPPSSQSNNQRVTRGKNILNQQPQTHHQQTNIMSDSCVNSVSGDASKSSSSTTAMPSVSSSSLSSSCMPYFMPPSSTDMTVINSSNDCFSSNAWRQNPQGNPYFNPHLHPQQTEQQNQQQQQYYLRRRTSSVSPASTNDGGISPGNFDPSKGDGGPPKVRNANQKQQFYNSHPTDVPLFVDCSVEYELPGVPKPGGSNETDPSGGQLLMVPPGWQQKRRITRSTSQQRLLEQQQWFRQHHQMQQEYQLQMQQQQQQILEVRGSKPQLNHHQGPFPMPVATTSSTGTCSTAVSNANSSRQYPQQPFGGNTNPNGSNGVYNNANNMFSQQVAPPQPPHQNLRPPFYPPFPPMHCCPQCPPMSAYHHSMIGVAGPPFVYPGVESSQHPPPPSYTNNNMVAPSAPGTSSSATVTSSSTSAPLNVSSRKRSYAEAAAGSLQQQQQQQIQQRIQFQQQQLQQQQQMNMRIGNNVRRDDGANTTTTPSMSSKRSKMSSSANNNSSVTGSTSTKTNHRSTFETKTGSTTSNTARNNTENTSVSKQPQNPALQTPTTAAVIHEKLPNGVCSCGATGGQFPPPPYNALVPFGPPNQNGTGPRNMAPPAAHSNQRPQMQHHQLQQHRPQHHMHLQHHHQQQLMQQQWAMSAQHRHKWSTSMVCCPPPLPAPPPPISGQPTFPTSHYWNELVPAVTSTSTPSNFQAPRQCRQTPTTNSTTNNKRSLRSQQQQNQNEPYQQSGNPNVTPSGANVTNSGPNNGWIMGGGTNYYQHQKQQHWLQQRYLQHQQNYHNLHQNHLTNQQLQHHQQQQTLPIGQQILHQSQAAHPLPPNNNNSLCRGCAEGKCPSSLPSSSGPSSLVALQRQSTMIQMQASDGSAKSSF